MHVNTTGCFSPLKSSAAALCGEKPVPTRPFRRDAKHCRPGKRGVKRSLLADGQGLPLAVELHAVPVRRP